MLWKSLNIVTNLWLEWTDFVSQGRLKTDETQLWSRPTEVTTFIDIPFLWRKDFTSCKLSMMHTWLVMFADSTQWLHTLFAVRCYASAAYVVMQCLCVCLSRSWIMSEWINISSRFFHRWEVTPFLFFHASNTPTGTPLTGVSNAGGIGRNRDPEPISGFAACC